MSIEERWKREIFLEVIVTFERRFWECFEDKGFGFKEIILNKIKIIIM